MPRGSRAGGGAICGATEQAPDLGDLFVDLVPFRSEVLEGGIQNIGCELLCHV
jgi:hypothetical protein